MAKRSFTPTQHHVDQLALAFDDADLIEVPEEPKCETGAFEFDQRMRRALNNAIKASPLSRDQVADLVSDYCGREVTKSTLDTFTGSGRPNRLPADLLPALTVVLGPDLLNEIALAAGCRVMVREEVQLARLGQTYLLSLQLREEMSRLVEGTPLFKAGGAV